MAKFLNNLFGMDARSVPASDAAWAGPNEYIGVEIEVEDFRGDVNEVYPYWITHHDGSLRNGTEFVFAGPRAGSELTSAIDSFFGAGYSYTMSPRTSTHIHINATDMLTPGQFRSWLTLVYLIEPSVFRWADENRKWCGYCAPLTDIPPRRMVNILTSEDDALLTRAIQGDDNQDRYFGLNVASLRRHGTLEFRYFPCTQSRSELTNWIQFVMETKRSGVQYENMQQLLAAVGDSPSSVDSFLRMSFPHSYEAFRPHLDLDDVVTRRDTLLSLTDGLPTWSEQVSARGGVSKSTARLLAKKFKLSDITPFEASSDDEILRTLLTYYAASGYSLRMLKTECRRFMSDDNVRAEVGEWVQSSANHIASIVSNASREPTALVEQAMQYFKAGCEEPQDPEDDDGWMGDEDEQEDF